MADTLIVEKRQHHGKRNARRLRASGSIPAILYGHGEENIPLTVSAEALTAAVRHGSRVVELKGVVQEKAFIREMQWDVYGLEVLHVDLSRVSEHERLHLRVSLELRGQAIGLKSGGVVEHLIHDLEIECPALSIPEKIEVPVSDLELDGAIHAGQLKLPPGVVLLADPDQVVVQCVLPQEEEAPALEGAGAAEPEVIGRKAEEEGAEE
ncbi:MAG TPA: 50S ribosomal protein L25 [Pirellulales bacterium]|nr:50S ribosomal protein L25 [Pirellulales bacterium]